MVRVPCRGEMISSIGCCRRSARLTAALRKLATELEAEAIRTLSMPADMEGAETATISAMMVTTTIISIRVTPLVLCGTGILACVVSLALPTDGLSRLGNQNHTFRN